MKKTAEEKEVFSFARRQKIYSTYLNRFYTLFMSKREIVGDGMDYQKNNFVFRKFWREGTIACYDRKDKVDTENSLLFFQYSVNDYNYLDFPVHIYPIKNRPYKFIPDKVLTVDEDVVIGWAQPSGKSPFEYIDFMCRKIADVEVTIRKNLRAHNLPLAWRTTTESLNKTRTYLGKIDADVDDLVFDYEDEKPEVMISGVPYIIDRLYAYKNSLVNECLTYLGINNMGESEKKEHLITSEVNVNNDLIKESGETFGDSIEAFVDRINKLFGRNLKVVEKGSTFSTMETEEEEEGEEEKAENV